MEQPSSSAQVHPHFPCTFIHILTRQHPNLGVVLVRVQNIRQTHVISVNRNTVSEDENIRLLAASLGWLLFVILPAHDLLVINLFRDGILPKRIRCNQTSLPSLPNKPFRHPREVELVSPHPGDSYLIKYMCRTHPRMTYYLYDSSANPRHRWTVSPATRDDNASIFDIEVESRMMLHFSDKSFMVGCRVNDIQDNFICLETESERLVRNAVGLAHSLPFEDRRMILSRGGQGWMFSYVIDVVEGEGQEELKVLKDLILFKMRDNWGEYEFVSRYAFEEGRNFTFNDYNALMEVMEAYVCTGFGINSVVNNVLEFSALNFYYSKSLQTWKIYIWNSQDHDEPMDVTSISHICFNDRYVAMTPFGEIL